MAEDDEEKVYKLTKPDGTVGLILLVFAGD